MKLNEHTQNWKKNSWTFNKLFENETRNKNKLKWKKRINYSGCHKTIILTPFEIKTKKKEEKQYETEELGKDG